MIQKHLDIIQVVDRGTACRSSDDDSHPTDIMDVVNKYKEKLWANTDEGEIARANATLELKKTWLGTDYSNDIQLYNNFEHNWNFYNKSKWGEKMTVQLSEESSAKNATNVFGHEYFTLLDLARKVSKGGIVAGSFGLEDNMDVNLPTTLTHSTPHRTKVIIIACQRAESGSGSGGSGGTKVGGRRKKRTRRKGRRKRKSRRRKKTKRNKTKKKRKRRRKK